MLFNNKNYSISNIRKHVVGIDTKVPTRSGNRVNYINFDNAASTPTFRPVLNKVIEFLDWSSSIHRGTGYKSMISTEVYDKCREIVGKFVNCDLDKNTVIFVKNTTEAINKLSYRLQLSKDDVVLTTLMEHHSNDLPWRNKANTQHIKVNKDGSLDINDLELKLKKNYGSVKLVAITGCSNVTGIVNDIYTVASIAHKYGSMILVDGAQLIPHRQVNMKGYKGDDYIDFFAFSGHKIYAPFGTGVLIGPKNTFLKGDPEYVGGGTIVSVSEHNSYWANLPDKEEAGTPNVVGTVALCESLSIIKDVGFNSIKNHEDILMDKITAKLKSIPNIALYSPDRSKHDVVGVITFNIKNINHNLLATLLSYEGGIGVRHGCFCAHPYVHKLLNLSSKDIAYLQQKLIFGDLKDIPGMVRVSFGIYNNLKEVDVFMDVLDYILANKDDIIKEYAYHRETGQYTPKVLPKHFNQEFSLEF